jgi:hypothetical protein
MYMPGQSFGGGDFNITGFGGGNAGSGFGGFNGQSGANRSAFARTPMHPFGGADGQPGQGAPRQNPFGADSGQVPWWSMHQFRQQAAQQSPWSSRGGFNTDAEGTTYPWMGTGMPPPGQTTYQEPWGTGPHPGAPNPDYYLGDPNRQAPSGNPWAEQQTLQAGTPSSTSYGALGANMPRTRGLLEGRYSPFMAQASAGTPATMQNVYHTGASHIPPGLGAGLGSLMNLPEVQQGHLTGA